MKEDRLIAAILTKKNSIVKHLLDNGYSPHTRECRNACRPAITLAFLHGNKNTVDLLLKAGADINSKDSSGVTPLIYTVVQQKKDQLIELIKLHARLDEVDKKGLTAAMYASRLGYEDYLKLLIDAGADINIITNIKLHGFNRTALTLAIIDNKITCFKLLMESGSDLTFVDSQGCTYLDIAQQLKRLDIVDLIVAFQQKNKLMETLNLSDLTEGDSLERLIM